LAAAMKILRFSRTCFWPMKSSSVCGRSASSAASSSARLPVDQAFRLGVHRASSCRPARITASSCARAQPLRHARHRAERLDPA
jgi:hypothetical protein